MYYQSLVEVAYGTALTLLYRTSIEWETFCSGENPASGLPVESHARFALIDRPVE